MRSRLSYFLLIKALVWGCLALSGCYTSDESDDGWVCPDIADDQKDSFFKPRRSFPLNVYIDSAFSPQDKTILIEAMDNWNEQARIVGGPDFFHLVSQDIPIGEKKVDPTYCEEHAKENLNLYIIYEYSDDRWASLKLDKTIPGVTYLCSNSRVQTSQRILFNMSYVRNQFKSVANHELGHAMGMDHSCNKSSDSPFYISCSKIKQDHPYYQSVLYPTLQRFDDIAKNEVKNYLSQNDKERAACLARPQ